MSTAAQTALSALLSFPKRKPVVFGLGFSCAKTSFADFVVQRYVEKREELDLRRNLTFGLFGLGYLGGVQYALYVPVFGRLFPGAASFAAKPLAAKLADGAGQRAVAAQVFLDQCVHHPLLYFPCFYATREVVEHGLSLDSLARAASKWSANLGEDMVALWRVWVPVMALNFAFSPMWLRIPVVATTSLAWTCILSSMRGAGGGELQLELEAEPDRAFDLYGNQGRALGRAVSGRGAALDGSKAHLVLTAAGSRRGGLLHSLSDVILRHGGNVVESRALQLGSDITLMMLVEVDVAACAGLHVALAEHQRVASDVHLIIRRMPPAAGAAAAPAQTASRFRLAAPDRPGLVHTVTKFFASHGMEVVDLMCEQREAEAEGVRRRIFYMEGLLLGPGQTRALMAGLKKLEGEQGIKITLDTAVPV